MIIEDKFTIAAPRQQVWDVLLDIPVVSSCMPGVENVEQVDEETFKGNLVVKVGPIKANFGLNVILADVTAPERLQARAQGRDKNTGSMVSATMEATLADLEPALTEVSHQMDVTIRGRLGQFGQGVMRETAAEMTAVFVACFQERVAAMQGAPGEAATQAAPEAAPTKQPSLIMIVLRAIWTAIRKWFRGESDPMTS